MSAEILEMTQFFVFFGRLLGAWAHHKVLRRLKTCQYWRTVYCYCKYGKFVGMLILICWQFVIQGQGSFVANGLGSASCTLHFGKFDQMKNLEMRGKPDYSNFLFSNTSFVGYMNFVCGSTVNLFFLMSTFFNHAAGPACHK